MVAILAVVHKRVYLADVLGPVDSRLHEFVPKGVVIDMVLVPLLELRHAGVYNHLLLGWHVGEDVLLDSAASVASHKRVLIIVLD